MKTKLLKKFRKRFAIVIDDNGTKWLFDKKYKRTIDEVYSYRVAAIMALSFFGYEIGFKTTYKKRMDWGWKYWWQKGVWNGK